MTRDLDSWMAELAAAPADRVLDGLEDAVASDIAARRSEARTVNALAPVRLATLGLALTIGLGAGGAAALSAVRTAPAGAFAAVAQLAPSTLLDGAG